MSNLVRKLVTVHAHGKIAHQMRMVAADPRGKAQAKAACAAAKHGMHTAQAVRGKKIAWSAAISRGGGLPAGPSSLASWRSDLVRLMQNQNLPETSGSARIQSFTVHPNEPRRPPPVYRSPEEATAADEAHAERMWPRRGY